MPASAEFMKQIMPFIAQQTGINPGVAQAGLASYSRNHPPAAPAPAPSAHAPVQALQAPMSAVAPMGVGQPSVPDLTAPPSPTNTLAQPPAAVPPSTYLPPQQPGLPQDDFWQRQLEQYYAR